MARRTRKAIEETAAKEFEGHAMSGGPVVMRRFRNARDTYEYAFDLTWTRGTLALSGDLGNLALVHHAALGEYRAGLEWVCRAGADFEYMMGKAEPRTREYDREDTLRTILDQANADLGPELIARRRRTTDYVRACRAAVEEWNVSFDAWVAEGCPLPREAPMLWEMLPARGEYLDDLEVADETDGEGVPDAFWGWFALWRALFRNHAMVGEAAEIFTAAGRREIARTLEVHLSEGGPERAGELCSDIGMDDYHGSDRYPDRAVWQIAAIRHGARMMLDELLAEEAKEASGEASGTVSAEIAG